ncbi:MAG: hypothetical protein GY768_21945 [Planctomycetaceae bacterium]|nr:hypothetical protein [Planctomycetaceae bacterium]
MNQSCLPLPFHGFAAAKSLSLTCLLGLASLVCSTTGWAQRTVHYQYNIDMPPGAIGARQLRNNYPFRGYTQPVKIQVPEGAEVAIASDGAFQFPSTTLQAGVLVGHVYRLKVSNIPRREGAEVYPSLEIINRLHPPQGMKTRFPVPVDIAQDDLELALAGKMVVRVIYVENPQEAFPKSEDPKHQRYFDVLPEEDPLQIADQMGRPIAILRLGSRMPNYTGPDDGFLFGSPPVSLLVEPNLAEAVVSPSVIVPAETDSVESDENADDLVEMPTENQRPSSEKGVVDEGTAVIDANDPFVDDELNEAN